jgi:hypothetical protein
MATFFGMRRLGGPDQWKGLAGDGKWVPTRSAYELAYAWHGANGIPKGMKSAFSESGVTRLAGLQLEVGFVEKPTFLDTAIGPSMTDIMGYARNRDGEPVILAVEGKATETFGLPVRAWIRGDLPQPAPETQPRASRIRRLKYLAERLGIEVDSESPLYYQLLHRTVAGIMEAALHGAVCAVLVVHSFAPDDTDENWKAYSAFLGALGAHAPTKGAVTGPIPLSAGLGIELYALWYQDKPHVAAI